MERVLQHSPVFSQLVPFCDGICNCVCFQCMPVIVPHTATMRDTLTKAFTAALTRMCTAAEDPASAIAAPMRRWIYPTSTRMYTCARSPPGGSTSKSRVRGHVCGAHVWVEYSAYENRGGGA